MRKKDLLKNIWDRFNTFVEKKYDAKKGLAEFLLGMEDFNFDIMLDGKDKTVLKRFSKIIKKDGMDVLDVSIQDLYEQYFTDLFNSPQTFRGYIKRFKELSILSVDGKWNGKGNEKEIIFTESGGIVLKLFENEKIK